MSVAAGRFTAAGRSVSPASAGRSRSSRSGNDGAGPRCAGIARAVGCSGCAGIARAVGCSGCAGMTRAVGLEAKLACRGAAAGAAGLTAGSPASRSRSPNPGAAEGAGAEGAVLVPPGFGFGARPTIVAFFCGGSFGAALPSIAGAAFFDGSVTRNVCPHFGHRIFNPVAGTRRSSTWYGALQDSHSTLSMPR